MLFPQCIEGNLPVLKGGSVCFGYFLNYIIISLYSPHLLSLV